MDVRTFENRRWSEARQKAQFRHRAALSLVAGGTVLDVGCGDGLLMRMLRGKGIQDVSGVDISDVAAAQCRADGFSVAVADIASEPLPFADGSFSCVVILDVLEHVYDPETLLRECARVASTSVIIGAPNFSSLPSRLQVLAGRVPENNAPHKGHVYWFSWPVLEALLTKCGLTPVGVRFNAPWERIPVIGRITSMLARMRPAIFALSFVVLCQKQPEKKAL